jgi:secondary thiamine-phosphate synthase enzyme
MVIDGPNGLIRHDGAVETTVLQLDMARRWLADLTDDAAAFCRERGDGLLHVFTPHATAGLALIELGSGTEDDLAEVIDRVLPRDDRYRHAHGALGHGADHVLPAIISPSLTVPVLGGRLALGTWQSIVLVDTNGDNPDRQVRLSFVAA